MARSSGRWRDLPERLGDDRSVKRRYDLWIEVGVLDTMLSVLAREADLEWLMIDSTIVRAHQHAAGARKEKGGRCSGPGSISGRTEPQDPCRDGSARPSRSPDRLSRTAQRHHRGPLACRGLRSQSDHCRQRIRCRSPVRLDRGDRRRNGHPAQAKPQGPAPHDADLYKERNRIERFFAKIKQFRRVATRNDKLPANFMGFIKIARITIWLKYLNRHRALKHRPGYRIQDDALRYCAASSFSESRKPPFGTMFWEKIRALQ